MSAEPEKLLDNGLRPVHRYITDHDAEGVTRLSPSVPSAINWQTLQAGDRFGLAYATEQIPVELSDGADVEIYKKNLEHLPGVTIPGGTVLRVVDIQPGFTSPMHRTISLDYGVVLEGEVELVLDSGVTQLLKRGDITVQRGTNHAWRNTSDTNWARMLYFLQEAKPLSFGGKHLDEDYGGGMDDVRASAKPNP